MHNLAISQNSVISRGKINFQCKALAKDNQKFQSEVFYKVSRKERTPLTYYGMIGGPFFYLHSVFDIVFFSFLKNLQAIQLKNFHLQSDIKRINSPIFNCRTKSKVFLKPLFIFIPKTSQFRLPSLDAKMRMLRCLKW